MGRMKIRAKSLRGVMLLRSTVLFISMKTKTLTCANCGKSFEKTLKEYTRQAKTGRQNFYCEQACASTHTLTKCGPVTRKCLACEKEFQSSTHKKHKKCCSQICAHRIAHGAVDRKKLSLTMKRLYDTGKITVPVPNGRAPMESINRKCLSCDKEFLVKPWMSKKTCGDECYRALCSRRFKELFKVRTATGTWTKWRKNTEPSYPEKYFMRVLDQRGIPYEFECPVKQYSIDFALHDKKIALEIDGQQHRFPERKISDTKKDVVLTENGWAVRFRHFCWHRIK